MQEKKQRDKKEFSWVHLVLSSARMASLSSSRGASSFLSMRSN